MSNNHSTSAFTDDAIPISTNSTTASVFPVHGLRVDLFQSGWTDSLVDRLSKLTSLQFGWDGYDGQPVSFGTAHFAYSLLQRLYTDGIEQPQLVPGSDGSLQIEWHENDVDIEIDLSLIHI